MPLASPAFFLVVAFRLSQHPLSPSRSASHSGIRPDFRCSSALLLIPASRLSASFAYRTYALIPSGIISADTFSYWILFWRRIPVFWSGLTVILFYVWTTIGSFGILLQRVPPCTFYSSRKNFRVLNHFDTVWNFFEFPLSTVRSWDFLFFCL